MYGYTKRQVAQFITLVVLSLGVAAIVTAFIADGVRNDWQGWPSLKDCEGKPDKPEPTTSETCYYACKDEIKQYLKAPGSARFPPHTHHQVRIDKTGKKFTIRSFVDAQNSFGVYLRSGWVCSGHVDGDVCMIRARLLQ